MIYFWMTWLDKYVYNTNPIIRVSLSGMKRCLGNITAMPTTKTLTWNMNGEEMKEIWKIFENCNYKEELRNSIVRRALGLKKKISYLF